MERLIVEHVIPYTPRREQALVHDAEESTRFIVVVAHRRLGKSVMAVNRLIKRAITCQHERPRMAYIGPTFRQAKAVAWDYLHHFARIIPGVTFNESELRCDLPNGAQIRLYGADNPDSLRGLYLDDVVLDEVGMMQERTWKEVIRPSLADRQGSALFIGTPNGHNLFWELRNTAAGNDSDWKLFTFPVSKTKLISDNELESAKRSMSDDEYAQEFECSFEASVRGSIYGRILDELRTDGHITDVSHEPLLAVHTAWDLGIDDSTAIWFMQCERGGDVRVIDYVERSGEGLAYFVNILQQRRYTWGRHILPHDVQVRELGTGKSRLEILRGLGINCDVAPNLSVDDGIEATRVFLRRCWFDAERCATGLDALANYRRQRNQRTEEYMQPVHDWASHGADALRYAAVGLRVERASKRGAPIIYSNAGIV